MFLFELITDYGMVREAVFYKAYKILTKHFMGAFDSLAKAELKRIQNDGFASLDMDKVMDTAGENSILRHLRPYLISITTKKTTDMNKAFRHLPNLLCEMGSHDPELAEKHTREMFESPWIHGRPLSRSTLDFANKVS